MTKQLGKYLGSFKSDAIPFLASIAIRLGWLKHRYAKYYVSDLEVYEEGICLKSLKAGGEDRMLRYADIRRVWYERYPSGNGSKGQEGARIDIIAQNLDVVFSLSKAHCPESDPDNLLMKEVHDRWRKATWKHYHVVAAIIRLESDTALEPHYLCMQKPDTRYAYTSRHWEFPGGKVEPGETEPEALHRELQEEMDYEVKVEKHLITIEHTYPDFSLSLSCWMCTAQTDQFIRKEHIDHKWLTASEMKSLEWCAADAPVLEYLNNTTLA